MSKIITVTANTAIDYSIQVNNLALGDNVRAESSVEFVSGKGINVAKAIESLQCSVYALGFVGRQSINPFNELKSELLHVDYTAVDGKTRTNITLFDSARAQETHIRTVGFSVTEADCQKLIDRIDAHAWKGDVVVLSGSLPVGARQDLYQAIIELCHKKSAIPFLDSSGESLKQGLRARPYLIKPNQRELEEVVGKTLADEKAIVEAARMIVAQGVSMVVVSRGEKGVIAVFDRLAQALCIEAPSGKVVSKIGCGDAMIAGLAVAKAKGYEPLAALALGVACGTSNLFSLEPGRFDRECADKIRSRVISRAL
jgi:1-phosphofructokinase